MTSQSGLTALQRRIRRIVGELPLGPKLALAGGGALIVSGVVDRPTTDLDFFAPFSMRIDEVVDLVQGALEADGLQVTRLDDKPSFARLRIEAGDDTTMVDLATDARLMATTPTDRHSRRAGADRAPRLSRFQSEQRAIPPTTWRRSTRTCRGGCWISSQPGPRTARRSWTNHTPMLVAERLEDEFGDHDFPIVVLEAGCTLRLR